MGNKGSIPAGKTVGSWSWQRTSN